MKTETERLLLYPIGNEEMQILIEQETDPELRQAYTEMLQGCIKEPENRIWYAVWLMELKSKPGTVVGDLCFKGPPENGMVELGYGLREGCCGKGYMTEAVTAITRWALLQKGVTCVEAETVPENEASKRVLSRAGFAPTGKTGEEGPRYSYNRGNEK